MDSITCEPGCTGLGASVGLGASSLGCCAGAGCGVAGGVCGLASGTFSNGFTGFGGGVCAGFACGAGGGVCDHPGRVANAEKPTIAQTRQARLQQIMNTCLSTLRYDGRIDCEEKTSLRHKPDAGGKPSFYQ